MPDADRLCEAVKNCRGDVMMYLPDGTRPEDGRQGAPDAQNAPDQLETNQSSEVERDPERRLPVLFQYMLEAAKAA